VHNFPYGPVDQSAARGFPLLFVSWKPQIRPDLPVARSVVSIRVPLRARFLFLNPSLFFFVVTMAGAVSFPGRFSGATESNG
jgi:hypothetical protein